MSLQDFVKKYIILDNEIREHTDKLKKLREDKHIYKEKIINYIDDNNLQNATIKINDGYLKFHNMQQNKPLTLKYLETSFNKFFKNDPEISKILLNFIKSERDINYTK